MQTGPGTRQSFWGAMALALLLLAAPAASANGAPHLKLVDKSATRLYSDGARWAAYEPVAGTTRIIDAATGRTINRRDPKGCAGGLVAVGSGELLYVCAHPPCPRGKEDNLGEGGSGHNPANRYFGCVVGGAEQHEHLDASYIVRDIATGAQHPLTGANHLPFDDSEGGGYTQLDAVGGQWVEGETNTLYSGYLFFLNWHTGELREDGTQPPGGFQIVEDLDIPGLLRPICTPVTRKFSLGIHHWQPPPFEYERPFAVENNGYSEKGTEGELHLRKCGSHQARSLPGKEAVSLQIGARIISWIAADARIPNNDDTMYLTRLNPHARDWHERIYTLRGPEIGADRMLLQHTSTTVYETTGSRGPLAIYAARIP
jgi:hypothetical protein